jgi:hypothetical protein
MRELAGSLTFYPHLLLSKRAQLKGFLTSRVTPKEWGILKISISPRQMEIASIFLATYFDHV